MANSLIFISYTLKYVSFVDEHYIRMVNERLLGRSLQDVKGEKVLVRCLVLAFGFRPRGTA